MNTKIVSFLAVVSLFLFGCQGSMPSKQSVGAGLGGIAGAVAGSQIGGGKGRDVAMVLGALLGAAVGGAVGNSMDQTDVMRTQQALSNTPNGQTATWQNPNTQTQYSMTPISNYQSMSGQKCRRYSTVALIDGKKETLNGTACQQPNGEWKAAN